MNRSRRLQLAAIWPAAVAILVAASLLSYFIPKLAERSAAEQLLGNLDALAPFLAPKLDPTHGDLQTRFDDVTGSGGLRLTIIGSDGVVLADSARTVQQVAQMDNHAGRPEIAQALGTGRGFSVRLSDTTGVRYAYAARTATSADGRLYVLRAARPLAELDGLKSSLGQTVAVVSAFSLLAAAIVAWWFMRRLFRPLDRLVSEAATIAGGDTRKLLSIPDDQELASLARDFNRLAVRVEETVAEAQAERDHLWRIAQSLADGLLVTDSDGIVTVVNPALREIFGLGEVTEQRSAAELLRVPKLGEVIDRTLVERLPITIEVEAWTPERRTVLLSAAPLAESGREAVVLARDVTEISRLAEVRRDFVANVSHELKTPLSAIRGFAETLRDGALSDPIVAERFTDRILDQCRRLQELLEDLLTLSRLESLDHRPHGQPVHLTVIAARALEVVQQEAVGRNVTLSLISPPEPIPTFIGDPESLERLILNLLVNGVRYNRTGGRVSLEISLRDDDVVIEVTDTGIGIAAESLPRLFERFYRVDKGRSRQHGGTGLGLAIVKHTTQLHGGRVEVESEPGQGSTFRVVLPLNESGELSDAASSSRTSSPA